MSKLSIDERFAQFEEDAVPTFKSEVDQVYTGVRKLRRMRRTRFVVAAVVVLALPAAWFGMDTWRKDAPTAVLAERKINVPGVTMAVNPDLSIIDANTAWAVYQSCSPGGNSECQRALGSTTDGGRTWRAVNLPPIQENLRIRVTPVSAQKFYISPSADFRPRPSMDDWPVWVTNDAGETYSPSSRAVLDHLGAPTTGSLEIECPGKYVGWKKPVQDTSCTTRLAKVGSGPLDPQPPVINYLSHVYNGADGRTWLVTEAAVAGGPSQLHMSADGGRTWQAMPEMPAGAGFFLSFDGKEVYYQRVPAERDLFEEVKEVAQLAGGKWVPQVQVTAPLYATVRSLPAGESTLLVEVTGSGVAPSASVDGVPLAPPVLRFFKEGKEYPVPAFLDGAEILDPSWEGTEVTSPSWIHGKPRGALPDGTLVLRGKKGIYVGTGHGMSREWTFITY